ncbi:LOW QUALITY PROTEIN: TGFB1-induced anti-apoptotic factor 1 [Phocoena sinus]|uniref:LOW QUALITY PROTEIN: TGFB1-induced anti-apoptotic factor 1 n=1 Tax=Phocoena sinus TaxID=42100 RepID=UPI0013C46644|nr:LOW QUALITY PROTEIN: TGFB1-induced anti-apoptotic factor 1 [Phocoena sinus]
MAGGLALHTAGKLTSISAPSPPPAQGRWTDCLLGHSRVAGSMGRSFGWEQQFLPHDLGEGFLFSVPAVLLLFNLNTQPLHHSCIPERGRGLWWQLARLPAPGMTRGTSASSLLLREQSFLCAAGETREQSWAQVLKSPCREGLSGASGFAEQAYADGGASVPARTSSPYPSLSHQCVKCNDPLKSKPIPPNQFRAYPSTASLPLCPSCLDHKLSLRGKALG